MLDHACHGRMLNAYDWGGYLIGAWTDPVATYGSSPSDLVESELALEEGRTDVRAWLDGQRVDLVLMPTGGALDRWLDETGDWTVAYRDPQTTVHARAGSSACPPAVARGGTRCPGSDLVGPVDPVRADDDPERDEDPPSEADAAAVDRSQTAQRHDERHRVKEVAVAELEPPAAV